MPCCTCARTCTSMPVPILHIRKPYKKFWQLHYFWLGRTENNHNHSLGTVMYQKRRLFSCSLNTKFPLLSRSVRTRAVAITRVGQQPYPSHQLDHASKKELQYAKVREIAQAHAYKLSTAGLAPLILTWSSIRAIDITNSKKHTLDGTEDTIAQPLAPSKIWTSTRPQKEPNSHQDLTFRLALHSNGQPDHPQPRVVVQIRCNLTTSLSLVFRSDPNSGVESVRVAHVKY